MITAEAEEVSYILLDDVIMCCVFQSVKSSAEPKTFIVSFRCLILLLSFSCS